jgi:hypothetical protein
MVSMATYTTKRYHRTPTMLDCYLIMPVKWEEKGILYKKKKRDNFLLSLTVGRWGVEPTPRCVNEVLSNQLTTPESIKSLSFPLIACANIHHFSRFASKKQKIIKFLQLQVAAVNEVGFWSAFSRYYASETELYTSPLGRMLKLFAAVESLSPRGIFFAK